MLPLKKLAIGLAALLLSTATLHADPTPQPASAAALLEEEQGARQTIDELERTAGEFDLALVVPLTRLGMALYRQGRLEEAEDALRRAQHITHREAGVYNLAQLPLVDAITAIQVRTGRYVAADRQQRFYYQVNEHAYGEESEAMLPAMRRMGRWLRATRQFDKARALYRRMLERVQGGEEGARTAEVEPLRALAKIRYLEGRCCAVDALEEVVEIVTGDPASDEGDRVRALLDLADMQVLERRYADAAELYYRAWGSTTHPESAAVEGVRDFAEPTPIGLGETGDMALSFRRALAGQRATAMRNRARTVQEQFTQHADLAFSIGHEERDAQRQQAALIGSPLPLCYPHVLDLVARDDWDQMETFFIDLDFTVSEQGRVRSIDIVESNTPVRLRKYVKNLLRAIRFRPRLEEGEPVATEHVAWRQTFASRSEEQRVTRFQLGDEALWSGCQLITARR